MKKIYYGIGSLLLLLFMVQEALAVNETALQPLIQYVKPLVGTSGFGNVYPGAQIPFGGIQISPDTDFDYYDAAAGYK